MFTLVCYRCTHFRLLAGRRFDLLWPSTADCPTRGYKFSNSFTALSFFRFRHTSSLPLPQVVSMSTFARGETMTVGDLCLNFEIRHQEEFDNLTLDFVGDGWAAAAALSRVLPFSPDAGDEVMVRECLTEKRIQSTELVRTSFLTSFLTRDGCSALTSVIR